MKLIIDFQFYTMFVHSAQQCYTGFKITEKLENTFFLSDNHFGNTFSLKISNLVYNLLNQIVQLSPPIL